MSPSARSPLNRRRNRSVPDVQLARHTVGNAMVVHAKDTMTNEAQSLAMSVAEDPDHDIVVVDLPANSPISMWESLADTLPRGRRGVRLVIGGRSRETTALAGQWLSERLNRTVVAPDGAVVRGAGGSLFVHSGHGSGWVSFRPGRPPQWEAKRFPRPAWDSVFVAEQWATSSIGAAEPVPGGVWIRPVGHEGPLRAARARLITGMPCQPEVLAIVLGSPGTPHLSLDDVARFWVRLPENVRPMVRFVQYGPMRLPHGVTLGQALANLLGEEVVCYTGMPVGTAYEPEVFTVRTDGSLGWNTFAQQFAYQPRQDDANPIPELRGHRRPVFGMEELAPAVYWYALDAVIEVVQAGLWVRPTNDIGNAAIVRSTPSDAAQHLLVFEAENPEQASRMRMLAEDVLGRLDYSTRLATKLAPVSALRTSSVRVSRPAMAEIGTSFPQLAIETAAELPVAPVVPAQPMHVEKSEPIALSSAIEAPETLEAPEAVDAVIAEETQVQAAAEPEPEPRPLPEPAAPLSPISLRLESASMPTGGDFFPETPAPAVDVPAPEPEPGPAPIAVVVVEKAPEPVAAAPEAPAEGAKVQPTPSPEAAGLLSRRGIDDERAWLRKTLSHEFGVMANGIARVLSEHPGFQGALSRSSAEVLTDAVAVRLYLSEQGVAIDQALRTATVGPHVPFARCVVAGLSRLPSHRGATVFTTTPTEAEWALYKEKRLFTEWGFANSLIEPCSSQEGEVDVLMWSMTARRTKLLEPDDDRTEDRVLFIPGTSFKVLDMVAPTTGVRGQILLRELASSEIDADGRVDSNRISLDELAMTSLRRCAEKWAEASPKQRVGKASAARFQALPGLA
jgi:hypothetical protein